MRFVLTMVTLAFALSTTSLHAQYYGGYRSYAYGAYGPWGGGGATVAGSYAAGMGQMIQAQGAYNQMTAVAATQMQEAQRLALDNKLKAAQTNYQVQKINAQERAERERYAKTLYAPAPPVKIPRLTSSQLDPVTGEISWPPVLNTPTFQLERDELKMLFTQRAANPSSVSFTQVQKVTLAMRSKLDAQITQLATADFFSARHFLESLAAEANYNGFETASSQTAAN